MRKPIIAGNWKMNMTPEAAEELVSALLPLVKGTNVHLGAQNVHWAAKGAFTGEISADMLKAFGVEYAIIGHSERRQYFGETDEGVNARAKAALAAGITPIICVGETLEQRESGVTNAFVSGQAKAALSGMEPEQVKSVVIAYEPIWAIGTGKTATAEDANATIGVIRGAIAEAFGQAVAEEVRIQYGGSMNPKNASELMAMPEIDGGLIGGASLKAEDFSKGVNY